MQKEALKMWKLSSPVKDLTNHKAPTTSTRTGTLHQWTLSHLWIMFLLIIWNLTLSDPSFHKQNGPHIPSFRSSISRFFVYIFWWFIAGKLFIQWLWCYWKVCRVLSLDYFDMNYNPQKNSFWGKKAEICSKMWKFWEIQWTNVFSCSTVKH